MLPQWQDTARLNLQDIQNLFQYSSSYHQTVDVINEGQSRTGNHLSLALLLSGIAIIVITVLYSTVAN